MKTKRYRLSEVLTIKNGKDYKLLQYGNVPVFGSGGYMCSVDSFLYDKPSVLLPRKGTLSNIQYFDKGKFWTVDTCFYSIIKQDQFDPFYIFCYLKNLDLSGFDTGASIPSMTQKTYNSIKVFLPSLPVQQKIASILSAYDSLIENNTKRIKLLEQMAENLYKEWFVRFRFPGHENVKMENGLPKGWKVERVKKNVEICYGKDHKYIEDGDIPIYGSGGIMRYGNKYLFDGESVLIPRKGSLNNVMYTNGKIWTVDTMFYSKTLLPRFAKYFYYTISNMDLVSFNSGAALPSMTTDILYHFKLLVPDLKILSAFDHRVESLFKQIRILQHQNSLLTRQRDLLLPRLMSGKLEVKP